MSDENKTPDSEDEGATFDMYHFFSRKDVMLAAIVIICLLIYVLFKVFGGAHVV